MKRNNSKAIKKLGRERIEILFNEAFKAFNIDYKLSNRYVDLARKIAMKAKFRIPSMYKRRFCKHCNSYLMPGKNARVRTKNGFIVTYCFTCKKYNKYGYRNIKK